MDYIQLLKESLALFILLPIVWFFLNDMKKAIQIWMQDIVSALNMHNMQSKKNAIQIQQKLWNTILDTEQSVDMLLSKMWFVSWWKLQFIKQILIYNHIQEREQQTKDKIKNELARRSQEYITSFSKFTTPVWDLWEWLNDIFTEKEFDLFLSDIYSIVFRKDNGNLSKDINIELKVNDIAEIMKATQNKLSEQLRKDILSINNE